LDFIEKFGVTAEDDFHDKAKLYLYVDDYFHHWTDIGPGGEKIERTAEDDLFVRFQEIIHRSNGELPWVSIESAFTCNRMRPDGFGGSAVFITADDIQDFGTSSWLAQRIGEAETDDIGPHTDDLPETAAQPARPTLGVVLEGGLISAVISNDPARLPIDEVVILDYDTEGADEEDLYDVLQPDGSTVQAYASITAFDKAGIDLESIVTQIRNRL